MLELEPGVSNVAKLTEGYDVGIDANTAHALQLFNRWKCMQRRSVLDSRDWRGVGSDAFL